MPPQQMTSAQQFRLALVLFFGSGACALAYETVWVRQLILAYGISVYAVLAAYMFGLCIGAYFRQADAPDSQPAAGLASG